MRRTLIVTCAAALLSAVAWALPWDTDMVDAVYLRAFNWKMMTLPENTISRNRSRVAGHRTNPASQMLKGPAATPADIKEGKRLHEIYCATCHAKGAPVMDNKDGKRFSIPAPMLSGAQSAVASKSDGYLFFTIRDGKTKADGSRTMPGYGYAMEDKDVWALVAYLRTVDGNASKAPAPAGKPEAK